MKYSIEMLAKMYIITPDLYKRVIQLFPKLLEPKRILTGLLNDEWVFNVKEENPNVESIANSLGLIKNV